MGNEQAKSESREVNVIALGHMDVILSHSHTHLGHILIQMGHRAGDCRIGRTDFCG